MTEENKQLAAPSKENTIRALLEKMKGEFALALPKLLTPDRFMRVALTAINKNPKLALCTRESLLACLLDCASLGIEPDGRRAHLIPYGDKCTLIIDYKGIAELVRRSGEISTLKAGIVYPSDDFDYAFGTGQFLKHKPALDRGEKEKPVCVYSYVKLKDGEEDFDVMSIADVERVRKRSRASSNGPWVTDFDEMAKKTVFRRHSKWLPLSPELRDKIEKDDEPLTEQERFAAAKPIGSAIEFGPAVPDDLQDLVGQTAPKPRGRPKKSEEEKPEPPRATPLQGLQNLMVTSKIDEGALLAHLFSQMVVNQGERLDTMPDDKIKLIIDTWPEVVEAMRKET